jgi:hypothetical protein
VSVVPLDPGEVGRPARLKESLSALAGRRAYVEPVATAVLVCAIALQAGRALADPQVRTFGLGHGSTFAFSVIALVLMALLRAASYPGFLAVATLAVMNGIPGVDVNSFASPGSFRVSDLAVVALMIVLATRQEVDDAYTARAVRLARGWAIAFVAWWAFTWIHTMLDGIPPLKAALFGRDFLYFAILVPLSIGAFGRRKEIYTFLSVLAIGVVVHGLAHIAIAGIGLEDRVVGLFLHETLNVEHGGVNRISAPMAYAVVAAVPIGLGLALIPVRRSIRLAGGVLLITSSVSVLLSFTRATYLGLTVAFLLVSAVWIRQASAARVALARVSIGALAAVLVLVISGGYRPLLNSGSATQAVSERASTAIADLRAGGGTVEYRYDLQKRMRRELGSHWVEGLGFLHPEVHPIQGLPSGSIRNTDIGVMGSVMTMGVVGTLFLYGPPLAMLFAIFRWHRRESSATAEWFLYGMAVWLLYAIITSLTLVTLFSVPGLVLTALLLGCAARLITEDLHGTWSPS